MRTDSKRFFLFGRWSLLGVLALSGACQEVLTGNDATRDMLELESPIVFGMVAFMSANGVREGRIEADTAYTYADSSKVDLVGMRAIFFDENGNDRATVTGRTGVWDQESDLMIARGDVVLDIHTDGSRLESEEIHYDPSIDRVWSDSATVHTLANGAVRSGSSFESDIAFENVDVRNPRGAVDVF